MADELDTAATPVVDTNTKIDAPAEKKKRAPRGSKMKPQAAVAEAPSAIKTRKPRQKKAEQPVEVSAPVTKAVKPSPVKRGPNTAVKSSTVSVAASDDFADLMKLEEENKALRAALGEQLRTENAELRKRLGRK